uniref:Uncharacterized protein n=1 Tax=Oncorhynchus mykiss TaxID=8022 RepID=A0A8K9UNV1_ONCMY
MSASLSCQSVISNALARVGTSIYNNSATRALHVTAACCKVCIQPDGDRPLTYEQALHPHHIGHRKGWLSQHTSNLQGEGGASDRTIVIKRRGNMLCPVKMEVQTLEDKAVYKYLRQELLTDLTFKTCHTGLFWGNSPPYSCKK